MESCTTGPRDGHAHLILAHGAGAPMTSPFMEVFAHLMNARGVRVTRFNFPYMTAFLNDGRRRPPPPIAGLAQHYQSFVRAIAAEMGGAAPIFIGGKSMGGRIATMIASELFEDAVCRGVVCLGYPFHPKGKPETLRTQHLEDLKVPTVIVQGERDALGDRGEISRYDLSPLISCVWMPDGDHDLKPRKQSGSTLDGNLTAAADAVALWISKQVGATRS